MEFTMQQYQDLETLLATLAAATGGTLNGATLDLFQSPIVIDRATVLADLEAAVATFTGYAQATITWNPVSLGDDGLPQVVGTVPAFAPTDSVHPNSIYGGYIRKKTSGELLYAFSFGATPLPMNGVLNSIALAILYKPSEDSMAVLIS